MTDELFQNLAPKDEGSVAGGFLLGFLPGLIINFFCGCVNIGNAGHPSFILGMIVAIAVAQLLFAVPFYRYFKNRGKLDSCRGLLIGVSVSCLIGVTCGAALSFNGFAIN